MLMPFSAITLRMFAILLGVFGILFNVTMENYGKNSISVMVLIM